MRYRLYLLVPALLAWLLLAIAPAALAHPMGNFSINHYTAITAGPRSVQLLYIVDLAEIPTFQELADLGVNHAGRLSRQERVSYLRRKTSALSAGLSLDLDGRSLPLQVRAADLIFPPGAGGLATERIYLVLEAPLPTHIGTLHFRDQNFPGRAGWKEIVARHAVGVILRHSSVPSSSRSHSLTVYPATVTSSPPQDLAATLSFTASGSEATSLAAPVSAIRQAEAPLFGPDGTWSTLANGLKRVGKGGSTIAAGGSGWGAGRVDALTNLIKTDNLGLGALLLSLVVAFWFGAGHALSPGHGKTIVAAYLVGNRGTAYHAVLLGLTVTLTHTAGVFALGLVTLYLSGYILPDQLYPWIGFGSGLVVAVMGLTLFVRRLRVLHTHDLRAHDLRTHGRHAHDHDRSSSVGQGFSPSAVGIGPIDSSRFATLAEGQHMGTDRITSRPRAEALTYELLTSGDGPTGCPIPIVSGKSAHRHGLFGRPHSHAHPPIQQKRVSLRSLIVLGVSGGILPCPSALVVLLSAIAFHRVAFGLLLIVAFSLGLATVLTGIGIVMVHGHRLIGQATGRRTGLMPAISRTVRLLPVFSAAIVALLGSGIALSALSPGMLPAVVL